ncbi:MAG: T9SS type A sorting domain-containing protein [Ignavibacteria bacterium]|jgi:hypothetical protein
MKRILPIIITILVCAGMLYSQPRAKIVVQPVTPYMLKVNPPFIPDSTVATGINTVANKNYVYLSVMNFGDTSSVTGASWTFTSKPSGSTATLTTISSLGYWAKFRTDVKGVYTVKVTMTTPTGSKDTTTNIIAADYVGTGGFQGIPATFPQCMTCHVSFPASVTIFNNWKVSGHANIFRFNIDSGSSSYSISCIKCHTTGYDHNLTNTNNGFDDVARTLGWNWNNYKPPKPGNWDSLKTYFPSLVAFASIGCESCHGPGSEHVQNGDTTKIQVSLAAGNCGQCHDSPPNHNVYSMWTNALHSNAIWESAFAQAPSSPDFGTNDLNNCIRCHDGWGYVNFTKGIGTNTNGMTLAKHEVINCATCHDPHGGPNLYQLRSRPTGSDTLATGYHYAGGNAKVCMDCHKSRRNNATYVLTKVTSSTWGPHSNPQSDVLLGKNAASFGVPYITGSHSTISDLCVTCHMAATTDTGTVTRDKVGGHSLNLHYDATNYDHVTGCLGCHPGVTKFSDFMAPADYDGNGLIQSWQTEINGCLRNLRLALPPVGVDSVSWQLIAADSNNVNLRKAYWNYQLINNDGSKGLHNPFFVVQVLLSSISYIGVQPISNTVPSKFELAQNYPNPFNPTTRIKFAIAQTSDVSIKIYDITGREVNNLVNQRMTPGTYSVIWTAVNNMGNSVSSGVYFYRIEAGNYVESKKMMLVR